MSRTKRVYNDKGFKGNYYHPYNQICCGNCKMCKDIKGRRKKKKEKRNLLKMNLYG